MAVSRQIQENLERSSWIRRMFEEGLKLKKEFGADKVFDFSLGNPDVEPPTAFAATLARLAADTTAGAHGYMPNAGYPSVRAAVAKKASRDQGLEIPAENIVMTVGAAGGLNVLLKTILDPGDEVVVFRPYFAEYFFYVQNHGGKFVDVPTGPGFSPDPEALRAALTPRTACVIINSPNNPTGRIYTKEELEAIAAVLSEHGRKTGRFPYLVADEPYREIVYGGALVPSPMLAYPETIVATSWSKSLSLPGERIGYLAVSPRSGDAKGLVDGLAMCTRILGFVNAPALMQRAVAELLDEKCDVASYERRGRLLSEGLRAAGYDFPEPEGAFYIFARVPELPGAELEPRGAAGVAGGASAASKAGAAQDGRAAAPALGLDVAFAMHLKKYNILAVPGVGFGCPGWFRLSYCVAEKTIRGALPLFAKAMEDWKAGS